MKKSFIIFTAVLFCSSLFAASVNFDDMDIKRIESNDNLVWTQFGPGGSGNNYFIHWHPTDPNVVFQGPNMGNSYISTDKGETYQGVFDCDGSSYKLRDKGPSEMSAVDFSRQDKNYGICTIEDMPYIYITRNEGRSWTRRKDIESEFDGGHIGSFCVDPKDDNIWYAGSGMVHCTNHCEFSNKYKHGYGKIKSFKQSACTIWKSTDKGIHWVDITPSELNKDAMVSRIIVSPKDSKTVFAATTYGFYKSVDGGISWEVKNNGFVNNIIRSFDKCYVGGKLYLYAIDQVIWKLNDKNLTFEGGVFVSQDEGNNWINVTKNMALPSSLLNSYTIKTSMYKALTGWFGKSISETNCNIPSSLLQAVSVVRVDPNDPNNIFVLNDYKSKGLHTFCGGMMWRYGDNGWFVTLRNGTSWEGEDKSIWESRKNPTFHNVDWALQDEWESRDPYDRKAGASIEFNADGSMIMYQLAKIVCVSTDGGDTWRENDEKETSEGSDNWVGAGNSNMPGEEIVQDDRLGGKVFFCSGENSIWETTNDGDNVRFGAQAVHKLNIPSAVDPEECSVSSMALDPDDPTVMYSLHFRQAFFGELMKSTDSGKTWSEFGKVFDKPEDAVGKSVHQFSLTIDSDDKDYFYCCIPSKAVSGVTNTDLDLNGSDSTFVFGVYRSSNGGVSWAPIVDGLEYKGRECHDVESIALDPDGSGRLYAAVRGNKWTHGGLFKLERGASYWVRVKTPNNMVSVNDVCFSQDGRMYISGGYEGCDSDDGGVWFTGDDLGSMGDNDIVWSQIFPYGFSNHICVAAYDASVLMVDVPAGGSVLNPGIYRSLDKGLTWDKVNNGNLQADRVSDLHIDRFQHGIYWCTTYGAGLYKGVDSSLNGISDVRIVESSVSTWISSGILYAKGLNNCRFDVVDSFGRVVLNSVCNGCNVSFLKKGVYFLRSIGGGFKVVKK